MPINFKKYFLGEKGEIKIEIDDFDTKSVSGKIKLLDGKIHIPGFYNLIKNLCANFEINKKTIIFKNIIFVEKYLILLYTLYID